MAVAQATEKAVAVMEGGMGKAALVVVGKVTAVEAWAAAVAARATAVAARATAEAAMVMVGKVVAGAALECQQGAQADSSAVAATAAAARATAARATAAAGTAAAGMAVEGSRPPRAVEGWLHRCTLG